MFRTHYQVVQGLWNPAKKNHSWIECEEFETIKEARAYMDERVAEDRGLKWQEKLSNEHREAYSGPPLAIMQVNTRIMERIGMAAPEEAAA